VYAWPRSGREKFRGIILGFSKADVVLLLLVEPAACELQLVCEILLRKFVKIDSNSLVESL